MKLIYWLGCLPVIAFFSGGLIAEQVHTLVLGLPFLMAWNMLWMVLTSAIMALMYRSESRDGKDPK